MRQAVEECSKACRQVRGAVGEGVVRLGRAEWQANESDDSRQASRGCSWTGVQGCR